MFIKLAPTGKFDSSKQYRGIVGINLTPPCRTVDEIPDYATNRAFKFLKGRIKKIIPEQYHKKITFKTILFDSKHAALSYTYNPQGAARGLKLASRRMVAEMDKIVTEKLFGDDVEADSHNLCAKEEALK